MATPAAGERTGLNVLDAEGGVIGVSFGDADDVLPSCVETTALDARKPKLWRAACERWPRKPNGLKQDKNGISEIMIETASGRCSQER